jgi:hypothetical protein
MFLLVNARGAGLRRVQLICIIVGFSFLRQ